MSPSRSPLEDPRIVIQSLKILYTEDILKGMFWLLAKVLNVWCLETTAEGFHRCRLQVRIQGALPGTLGKVGVKGRTGWIERIFWRIPRRGEQLLLTAEESRNILQPVYFERPLFDEHHSITLYNPQGLLWSLWEGSRRLDGGRDPLAQIQLRPRKHRPRQLILKVDGRTVDRAILAPQRGVHRYSGPGLIYGRTWYYLENGLLRLGVDPKGGRVVLLQDMGTGQSVWKPSAEYHFASKALVPFGLGLSLSDQKPWLEDMEVWWPRNRLEIGLRKKKKKLWVEARIRLIPQHPIFQVEIHIASKQTSHQTPRLQWAFPHPEDLRFRVVYRTPYREDVLWAAPPARFSHAQEVHEWSFPLLGIVQEPLCALVHFPEPVHPRLLSYPEGPVVDFRLPAWKGKPKRWVHQKWTFTVAIGKNLNSGNNGMSLQVPKGQIGFTLEKPHEARWIEGTPFYFLPEGNERDVQKTGRSPDEPNLLF